MRHPRTSLVTFLKFYKLGKPLSEEEKLTMVQFMDESYRKFGGEDSVGYNKYLRNNVEELKNSRIYSELELARNTFNPNNSKYLSPDEH